MTTHEIHTRHERLYAGNRFVYPVVSRRSKGVSVGVNLNPDRICNFDCIYCQVDRRTESDTRFVELDALLEELERVLQAVVSEELFETERFGSTPPELRRLNDIAFSGDGEPTTHTNFDEVIEACASVKENLRLSEVKMVLITNASMFHREHVQRGLAILDNHQGEIWAKLDAGTEAYYQKIERTPIPFSRILENITTAAIARPLVIQSLFMRVENIPPGSTEIAAYCQRLNEITAAGGNLSLLQIYTVARKPAESIVTPLLDEEVDEIANQVQTQTGLRTEAYYGASE